MRCVQCLMKHHTEKFHIHEEHLNGHHHDHKSYSQDIQYQSKLKCSKFKYSSKIEIVYSCTFEQSPYFTSAAKIPMLRLWNAYRCGIFLQPTILRILGQIPLHWLPSKSNLSHSSTCTRSVSGAHSKFISNENVIDIEPLCIFMHHLIK